MKQRSKRILKTAGLALAAICSAGVLVCVCAYFRIFHEERRWHRTFESVPLGMNWGQVDGLFSPLSPRERFHNPISPADRQRYSAAPTAESYLFYRGPNHWQYQFLLDAEGKVVMKLSWWD